MADLARPKSIHWVDGSQEEYDLLCDEMVKNGTLRRLNQDLWPGCFYARSDPNDVARVESRTFVCSLSKADAGPTNNWMNPFEMRTRLRELFAGAMAGRTPAGPLTFGRITTADPEGKIRTYVGEGELTNDPLDTFGTRAVAHVPNLQRLMHYVCKQGFEHHVVMTVSRSANILAEAFGNYLEWEVYQHTDH